MNVDNELIAALQALRTLDLPDARYAYLHRVLIHAPTSADRQRIVSEARQEVTRNAYRDRVAIQIAYDEQREREALRSAQNPRRPPTKLTDEHRRQVREMREAGATLRAISEEVGISESAVARVLSTPPDENPVIPSKRLKRWEPTPLDADDPRHGTPTGYMNHGCRCEPCKVARKVYRAERKANPTGRAKKAEHGTPSKYARGCRCDECRNAVTVAARETRARKRRGEG